MGIDLVRIHRDSKGSLAYLETAIERVHAMSHRLGGDADALVNEVWDHLAKKSTAMGLWVGVNLELLCPVVGHLLCFIRPWDGRYVVWVTQTENDAPPDRTLTDLVIRTIEDFGEQWNASFANNLNAQVSDIFFVTPRSATAFARHSGFEDHRTIMRRAIRGA